MRSAAHDIGYRLCCSNPPQLQVARVILHRYTQVSSKLRRRVNKGRREKVREKRKPFKKERGYHLSCFSFSLCLDHFLLTLLLSFLDKELGTLSLLLSCRNTR